MVLWSMPRVRASACASSRLPGDEYSEDFVYEGAMQVMKAALLTGWEMAAMEERVRWEEGDPFGRIRSEPPLR